jgi:hypothetical protein
MLSLKNLFSKVSFTPSLRRLDNKVARLVTNGSFVTTRISMVESILIEYSKVKEIGRPILDLSSPLAGIKASKIDTTSPFDVVQYQTSSKVPRRAVSYHPKLAPI